MKAILDTGPLVALLNRSDRYHSWAQQALSGVKPPLWTCEPVLAEACHLTGQARAILEMVSEQRIRIGLDLEEQAAAAAALLARYRKRMDLADACVVRMSELTKRCVVITLDRRDFSFYRRNGREVIPLVAPESD